MKKIVFVLFVFISAISPCDLLLSQETKKTIDGILRKFYEKHQIPGGVSLAISYKERLVYADKDRTVKLTPEHRMRIASLSKPITSIAIMKLMEERKLRLDERVFGENGVFKNKYGMPTYREKSVDVTIRHLLEHNSGGWGRSMRYSDNISRVLETSLEHPPGTHYDYSNFGFYVLGRVIEAKSGMTYENYVKENILKPSGIDGMRIGTTRSGPDEVDYIATVGTDINPSTYNNPVRLDSAGGWVASPIELLKILVRVDGFPRIKDILDTGTIRTMTTRSKTNNLYALGWSLNQSGNNWYHSGGQPGVTTIMARSSNGFNWAIMVNYQAPDSTRTEFSRDLDDLFWQVFRTVKEWQAGTEL